MLTWFHTDTALWIVMKVTAVDKNKISKRWQTRYLILMLALIGAYSFRKPENWVTPRVYELANTIIYVRAGIRVGIEDYGKDFRTIMSDKKRAVAYGYQVQTVF